LVLFFLKYNINVMMSGGGVGGFGGGGGGGGRRVQQIQLRTEDRQNGDLRAVAP